MNPRESAREYMREYMRAWRARNRGSEYVRASADRIRAYYLRVKGTPEEKERRRKKAAKERALNREKLNERTRVWRSKNPNRGSEYRREHLARYAAHTRKRYAGLKTATPTWSEGPCIVALYYIAASLRASGVDVQVDHEVPLKGKTVSGLHVRNNLRLVPSAENQRKGNRFEDVA